MTPEQIIGIFTNNNLFVMATKLAILFLIFLYAIFAGVIVRQIQLMNKIVMQSNFAGVLFGVALIHFLLVIGLFVLTLLIL
jgi:hypothetical protein